MKILVILSILFFFSYSSGEQMCVPEHVFLYNYNCEENDWDITTSSTINRLTIDATTDSLHLLDDALSYSGSVSIPFENMLPLNETHNLYLKKHGKRLSGGVNGVFSLSKLKYTYTVAESNARPGYKESINYYYSKSRTMVSDHSTYNYGGICNIGLNWPNKTAVLTGGGSVIQNTGYMITIDNQDNTGSGSEIIDFDKKDISYNIHGGLLFSGNATVLRRTFFYFLSVEAAYSHIKIPVHAPQTINQSLCYTGKKTETTSIKFHTGAYQFSKSNSNSAIVNKTIRPLHIRLNNVQIQINSITDTITDYKLDNEYAGENGIRKRGFNRKLYEFNGTIVPELMLFHCFNLQLNSSFSTTFYNSKPTNNFISVAGIGSFDIPFKNGLLARVLLGSGDFKFHGTLRDGSVSVKPLYCAYAASIAVRLSMR